MGMDLIPADAVDPYHFNWWGWSAIGDLLEELGCDLSLMAGSNDGEEVDQETASNWGNAIHNAIKSGSIFMIEFPSENCAGAKNREFHVEGSFWADSSPFCSPTTAILSQAFLAKGSSLSEEEKHNALKAALALGKKKLLERMGLPRVFLTPKHDEAKWLLDAGDFFIASGGFCQC